jgi:Holliday junction resolvase
MPNKNYRRGADKERKIVRERMPRKKFDEVKEDGVIAFRSAGSHSPIDVISIDFKKRVISCIQCKHTIALRGGIDPKLKEKLEDEWKPILEGDYKLVFEAL